MLVDRIKLFALTIVGEAQLMICASVCMQFCVVVTEMFLICTPSILRHHNLSIPIFRENLRIVVVVSDTYCDPKAILIRELRILRNDILDQLARD